MSRILVKICGTTSIEDAYLAAESGADFIGVIVEHAPSPRSVSLEAAQDIAAAAHAAGVPLIAVTVNQSLECLLAMHETLQPAALQLHGDETPELVEQLRARGIEVWGVASGEAGAVQRRARLLHEAGATAILVDARTTRDGVVVFGGTGHLSDWDVARELVQSGVRTVLAGGLSPDNVAAAVQTVRPWMVDAISGIEARKGVKDADKVRRFIAAARL